MSLIITLRRLVNEYFFNTFIFLDFEDTMDDNVVFGDTFKKMKIWNSKLQRNREFKSFSVKNYESN